MSEDVRIGDIDVNMSEEIPLEVIPGSSSETIGRVDNMVTTLREKEILALRTNASLLQEKVVLLENASKKNEDQLHMNKVELDFMHKENDRIKSEAKNESARLLSEIEMLKKEVTSINEQQVSEVEDLKTKLACEKGKNMALSEKLQDCALISERTMLAFNTQQDLVAAKQEIIESLRREIGNIKQSQKVTATEQKGENVTSNIHLPTESTAEQVMVPRDKMVELTNHYDGRIKLMSEESDLLKAKLDEANLKLDNVHLSGVLKNGVQECCEFINIHAKNGAITSGLLLWADIQRKQHPDSIWKAETVKKFSRQEITEAKDILWRTAGESLLGKIVNRQGNSKSASEVNDISIAFKKLEEKDAVPMLLCTSGMVAQTPVFDQDPVNKDAEKLDVIDTSVKSIIQMLNSKEEADRENADTENADSTPSNNIPATTIDTALGNTMAINDTETSSNNDGWTKVLRRNGRFSQRWKDESRNDKHFNLVVSGFEKGTRGIQIVQYVVNKDVDVIDCSLLTRREDATFLTFKITVKHGDDADKIQDPQFWPEGTRIRSYKPPTPKGKSSDKQRTNNLGSSHGVATQKQANNRGGDAGNASVLRSDPEIINSIPTAMYHQMPYNYPGMINGNDWSRLQNSGMFYPQNVAGGFTSMGNQMGEKMSSADVVRQNLQQGNSMPQHSPVIPGMNSRSFDTPPFNAEQLPQRTLYVPSAGKQRQVRFLDRLGADTFVCQQ